MATMWSPGRRPALAAGVSGSLSRQSRCSASAAGMAHLDTEDTTGVSSRTPKPIITTANSTNASTKFIAGPPVMMMTFCHQGLR